jgi:lactam utilization protein B
MKYIDVANIACGFHTGYLLLMFKTIHLAKANNVKMGVHPGLQDLFGFGRRKIKIDPEDIRVDIIPS